ncbi:hypothetical protein HWV62_26837 [Athelia sp. TMB]|nr:hypothetical protein HWV62_26837 [Athelia sp. TMB]
MSATAPITHSDIWFEDGNVVLQAERTQFRVYRGMLARNSSVFRDMFSIPQPAPSEESADGCAVVCLPDAAQDVEIVLRALTEPGFVIPGDRSYLTARGSMPIERVAALLRLGQKYDFEALRTEALHRIFYEVPTTLEDFDSHAKCSQIYTEVDGTLWPNLLKLARDHNLQSALPLALYRCSGGIDIDSEDSSYPFGESGYLISVEDQILCLSCFSRLMRLHKLLTKKWLQSIPKPFSACVDTGSCNHAHEFHLRNAVCLESGLAGLDDGYMYAWRSSMLMSYRVCQPCNEVIKAMHNAVRQDFWAQLPEIFGLPGWDELRKERAESVRTAFCSPYRQRAEYIFFQLKPK